MPMQTKRLIYKDDKRDKFHVYTSQELEQKNEINLLRQKAVSLYELALEMLKRVEAATENGNLVEANHWEKKVHECKRRGLTIEEEALKKQLELLESIGQIEGWGTASRGGRARW
jgi:regulator of RNase E activity RraB